MPHSLSTLLYRLRARRARWHHIVAAIVATAAAACADAPTDRPATWTYVYAAVLAPSCATASCHGGGADAAGLDLSDADLAYQQLLSRAFVVPGDPASTLLALLAGQERRRMPPDAPLPRGDQDLVRAWIEAGAPR